jgi:hypothetical protein
MLRRLMNRVTNNYVIANSTNAPLVLPTITSSKTRTTITVAANNSNNQLLFVGTNQGVIPLPKDGIVYTCDLTFGAGQSLGNGWYAVYSGNAMYPSGVSITLLARNTYYYSACFPYSIVNGTIYYNRNLSVNVNLLAQKTSN